MPGQFPDYKVVVTRKNGKGMTTVGAAWIKDGKYGQFISINLGPGVQLSGDDDNWVNLYPTTAADRAGKPSDVGGYVEDDHIPF